MLMYIANVSLDGYLEDAQGNFDFTEPSDEVFAFITDLIRPATTYVYGRRMYETMAVWETDPSLADASAANAAFASLWRAADKVVYSTTLESTLTDKTRLERVLDIEAVRALKVDATGDITIGGPTITAPLFEAGLVDEIHLFMAPVLLGGGKPALPARRIELELVDERRFGSGTVYLRHAVRS